MAVSFISLPGDILLHGFGARARSVLQRTTERRMIGPQNVKQPNGHRPFKCSRRRNTDHPVFLTGHEYYQRAVVRARYHNTMPDDSLKYMSDTRVVTLWQVPYTSFYGLM